MSEGGDLERERRARSDSRGKDPCQLTSLSSDYHSGESTSELLEVSSPPLVIISSRVKSHGTLVHCVNPGVAVVKYTYETTSLTVLLRTIGNTLKGRQALSIALLVHGQPGYFKICSQKVSVLTQP